jgi:hypothetical protein
MPKAVRMVVVETPKVCARLREEGSVRPGPGSAFSSVTSCM